MPELKSWNFYKFISHGFTYAIYSFLKDAKITDIDTV